MFGRLSSRLPYTIFSLREARAGCGAIHFCNNDFRARFEHIHNPADSGKNRTQINFSAFLNQLVELSNITTGRESSGCALQYDNLGFRIFFLFVYYTG